jgi:hypothetical protein
MGNSTTWVAWIGAATGVCSLVWNIYLKITTGPKLRIEAHAGMVLVPPEPGDHHFLRIVVRNVGSAPTTITNYTLHSFGGFLSKLRRSEFNAAKSAVITAYRGNQCPTKLNVGEEVSVLVEHDQRFDEWLRDDVWVGVSHTFRNRAKLAKIYDGRKATAR